MSVVGGGEPGTYQDLKEVNSSVSESFLARGKLGASDNRLTEGPTVAPNIVFSSGRMGFHCSAVNGLKKASRNDRHTHHQMRGMEICRSGHITPPPLVIATPLSKLQRA